jgi:hypothetical protein
LKAVAAVTAGVVIGGASVATVEQKPWKRHAKAVPAKPVFRSVAPRKHVSVAAVPVHTRRVGHAAKQTATRRVRAVGHDRGLGRQKHAKHVSSHHVVHVGRTHPLHPVHPSHARVAKPKLHKAPKRQSAQGAHGGGGNGKSH